MANAQATNTTTGWIASALVVDHDNAAYQYQEPTAAAPPNYDGRPSTRLRATARRVECGCLVRG